jgi:hypothetical protein
MNTTNPTHGDNRQARTLTRGQVADLAAIAYHLDSIAKWTQWLRKRNTGEQGAHLDALTDNLADLAERLRTASGQTDATEANLRELLNRTSK